MNASRLSELRALSEIGSDSETSGRIAFHEGEDETDNPFWEPGLFTDEQSCRALEWQYGWQDEYDAAHATAKLENAA
jgi:hypothetical protein